MVSLRRRLSDKLLNAGTTMAFDTQEMHRAYRAAGARRLTPSDAQLMLTLETVSSCMIRLGMWIMPTRTPVSKSVVPKSYA